MAPSISNAGYVAATGKSLFAEHALLLTPGEDLPVGALAQVAGSLRRDHADG